MTQRGAPSARVAHHRYPIEKDVFLCVITLPDSLSPQPFCLDVPAPVSASIQPGDFIKMYDRIGAPGGIFEVDDQTNPDTSNFYTFCVEVSENITFSPDQYKVASLGITTVATNKTITDYTAWLYSSFLDGTFNSGTFNSSSLLDVNALQLAIWLSVGWNTSVIDDYITSSWITTYSNHLATKPWKPGGTGAGSFANSGWTGLGGVQVMNLLGEDSQGNYTKYAQDQLIRIPPPGGIVPSAPEAASFVVWSLLVSIGTMAAGRRRS